MRDQKNVPFYGKRPFILTALLVTVLSIGGCLGEEEKARLLALAEEGEYEELWDVIESEGDDLIYQKAELLAEESPRTSYFLGRLGQHEGRSEIALPFLEAAAQFGSDTIVYEAAINELIKIYLSQENYRAFLNKKVFRDEFDLPEEVALYRAIGEAKRQLFNKRELYTLFFSLPPSRYHVTLLALLKEKSAYSLFNEWEWAWFEGKTALAQKEYTVAVNRFLPALNQREAINAYPQMIHDIYTAAKGTSKRVETAETLISESRNLSSMSAYKSAFKAGRLYELSRLNGEAEAAYRTALSLAPVSERDRTLWYQMRLALTRERTGSFYEFIVSYSSDWRRSSYFNDIIERYIALLLQKREWQLVEKSYRALLPNGSGYSVAQYAWVVRNLKHYGYLPVRGPTEESSLLRTAFTKAPDSYWGVVSAYLLGEAIPDSLMDLSPPSYESHIEEFFFDFVRFNMYNEGVSWVMNYPHPFSFDQIASIAEYMQGQENYLKSMQLINKTLREEPLIPQKALELLYPAPYEQAVRSSAQEFGISPESLFALVKKESAFEKDIVSRSGAIGLSQLMYPTAMERAGELKMTQPNLNDPLTNVRIGSSHIKWLRERPWTESKVEILMAYNAGGGYLRSWKRKYPNLPETLFIEAIPFIETRDYVRKIVVFSLIYGYLYNERPINETLTTLLPAVKEFL